MADEFAANIKEIGDKIVALTVAQAVQLGDYLEKVHGIKPAAGGGGVMMAVGGPAAGPAEKPAEKTEFTPVLDSFDAAKKIAVIKVAREVLSLGLAEAKAFVEGAPKNIKENVAKDEAEMIKKKFEEAGGKVTIK
jgi:large subunit ribosomal protein L7/L12